MIGLLLALCCAGSAAAQVSLSSTTHRMFQDLQELTRSAREDAGRYFDQSRSQGRAAKAVVVPQNVHLTPGQLRGMQARGEIQMSDSRVVTRSNLAPKQQRALDYALTHPARAVYSRPPTLGEQVSQGAGWLAHEAGSLWDGLRWALAGWIAPDDPY